MALPPNISENTGPVSKKPDAAADTFVREVDDAVRQDTAARFWSKYGIATISILVAAFIGYAGWLWYAAQQNEANGAQGGALVALLDKADKGDGTTASTDAQKLAKNATPAYRAAALLAQGNIAFDAGNAKQATALFAKLAGDTNAPDDFRKLALVRQTISEMDSIAPALVLTRMQPLITDDATWAATAIELSAVAQVKLGKFAEAQALYGKLVTRKDAPNSLKTRASQMASMLSGAQQNATPKTAAKPITAEPAKEPTP